MAAASLERLIDAIYGVSLLASASEMLCTASEDPTKVQMREAQIHVSVGSNRERSASTGAVPARL